MDCVPCLGYCKSLNIVTNEETVHVHLYVCYIDFSVLFCQENVTVYIILLNKLNDQENVEMGFSGQADSSKRVPGIFVNEYTISCLSPGMCNMKTLTQSREEEI